MEEPSPDPDRAEPPERRDADGLPIDREPTLDDVRGGANHFKIAVGCSVVVLLVVLAFGVLRVLLAG
jgi:hypothetical protein